MRRVRAARPQDRVYDGFLCRPAAVFPGRRHRLHGGAWHGQRPGHGRRAAAVSERGFIIEEGLPMDTLWRVVCSMRDAAQTLRRADHHRRHQGGGQGQGRRRVHQHRRHGRDRTRPNHRARTACGPATRSWSAAMWAGTAWRSWPCAKGLEFESRIESDSAPVPAGGWNCCAPGWKSIACAT